MNPRKKKRHGKRCRSRHTGERKNPFLAGGRGHHGGRKRGRRNPRHIGGMDLVTVGKLAVGGTAGALATRGVTQLVLGEKNTGLVGYGANAGVALVLGYGTAKLLGADWGAGVVTGGLIATLLRVWSDKVSQTSLSALSGVEGLGDLDFSSDGVGDLQDYIHTNFAIPSVSEESNGNYTGKVSDPFPAPAPVLPAPAPGGKTASVARLAPRFTAVN